MYDYIALRVSAVPCNETITDLIADCLAETGFESFEPDEKGVTAYIRKDLYDRDRAEKSLEDFPIELNFNFEESVIEGEDWNKEWEQNYFRPILIADKVVVRSSFHQSAPEAQLEILIDPKMAFGTGHHATTAGMIKLLLEEDMHGKRVIDMGSGTGILAILCKKRGAGEVTAIEIDPYALENAVENGQLNQVEVNWICGDASSLVRLEEADYFLANINLNVILADLEKYVSKIKPGGKLLLSGFYEKDLDSIKKSLDDYGLKSKKTIIENEWVASMFEKPKKYQPAN